MKELLAALLEAYKAWRHWRLRRRERKRRIKEANARRRIAERLDK